MNHEQTELLLLKIRDAIANKEFIIASANMETAHRDGWSCDWPGQIGHATLAIEELINMIERKL